MNKVKKNPSRLRPFDQQDRNFFEQKKAATFIGFVEQINFQLKLVEGIQPMIEELKRAEGIQYLDNVAVEVFAKSCRNKVRDLKVFINQFQEHLEQIEVSGEWK